MNQESAREIDITIDKGTQRLGKVTLPLFVAVTSLGILFSINEIFMLGFVYHEFFYFYGMLAIFFSSAFAIFPAHKGAQHHMPWYDYVLLFISVICCVYMMVNAFKISDEGWVYSVPLTATVVSVFLWFLALEALRRVGGLPLFFFAAFFSFFPLFAEHMPGFLEGAGWDFLAAARFHAMTSESIIGIPTRIFCEMILGFMIFGVTLQDTGGAKFFIDVAYALFGTVRGGPAKVAVIASGFFGSMSGSAISNVVTIGPVTIPTMKKAGFPPYYAAAVEACASSGGCIMPPVMGGVAFIMASFLQVPYSAVALAAFVPALLYYWGIFVQIDCQAAKEGLKGMPREELPSLKKTLKNGWIYLFAMVALCYFLFYLKREAQAPYYASLMLLIGASFKKETRPSLKSIYHIIENSGKLLAEMLAMMAGIGLLIGGLSMTGVAIAFSSDLIHLVGSNALLLLIVGAVVSFILGMGMTISACYVFLAIVLIPALTPFNFDVMAVHMFVLYCGLFSFITPPVALASMVAAGIAGADQWQTGVQSMKLGVVKYLVPFFFVYQPALLLHGSWKDILIAVPTSFVGVCILGSAIEGYMISLGRIGWLARVLFFSGGMLLFFPEGYSNTVGWVLSLLTYITYKLWKKSAQPAA
jgi:TRAP transporter 4TM/12TM fusion protein